ncbi:fluoride efflux transporter CrcB [Staphylococcus warneri]|uniref:fluoride efflux transporter CrcB n=1 Tax=Staphylococcus warneri TaxID=1292 RepID=UPI001A8F8B41|nr:fluoride efflux transporter CrcB [Staphylococcus warneri]MBO0377704.1 fluoride efflux transporter CrcB [Staphylococcus warneri]
MQYLFIFIGGAFGALMRYLFSFFNHGHDIPIGTLSVNLIGGFFMGFLSALTIKLFNNSPLLKKAVTTGFMGALTTFSTFQFELVQMFNQQQWALLIFYDLISYILCILLCLLGKKLGEQI